MKKKLLIIVSLSCLAISAQAVAFVWESSEQIKFGGTTLNSSANQATAYLVYLGADGAWSFDGPLGSLDMISDTTVGSAATKTAGAPAVKGKYGSEYTLAQNQGFSYGVVLTYTDANADVWYNISSDIFTVDSGLLDNAQGVKGTFGHLSTVNAAPVSGLSSAQVGGGWYTVPEPATAALAIAGLAMLIRRRK